MKNMELAPDVAMRMYIAFMLRRIWRQEPIWQVNYLFTFLYLYSLLYCTMVNLIHATSYIFLR